MHIRIVLYVPTYLTHLEHHADVKHLLSSRERFAKRVPDYVSNFKLGSPTKQLTETGSEVSHNCSILPSHYFSYVHMYECRVGRYILLPRPAFQCACSQSQIG